MRLLEHRMVAEAARRLGFLLEPESQDHVAREQLRAIWQHSSVGIVVASTFAVLLAVYLHGEVAAWLVRAWLAAKLGVSVARLAQARIYVRHGRPGTPGWSRATLASLAVDGLVWGAAGFWMMSVSDSSASLVAAALACISCVATFGLQVSMAATSAYVLPILLPTTAGLLIRGDDFGAVGGAGLMLLLALQLATAQRSERRLAESVLLRLQAEQLARDKDEALKLALRQSAVKSQFLANISHELRTPLHGILGLARLLHMESENAALARRVELIEASGTHLLSIINDLLDISRIEAGQFAMRRDRFEVAAQLEHVAGTHAVRAEDKGLKLTLTIDVEPPVWAIGDAARFRQVLHNLIGNAIKFTQRGTVHVSLGRVADAPAMLQVQVRDTGPGIPAADLQHIFEAFRQSGAAASRPLEGAGLGLTIAREIARAMGGDVVAQSAPGVGSTMTFTACLPPASPPDNLAAAHEPAGSVARLVGHVLIAEDDNVNALIATAYLERFGVSVERVEDGRSAVRRALREGDRPDLVLMDCRMPLMDGYAATREIRVQEAALGLPRLPVIALTATVTDADRQLCLDAGMDDFVSKPFTIEQLAQVLSHWISVPLTPPVTAAE